MPDVLVVRDRDTPVALFVALAIIGGSLGLCGAFAAVGAFRASIPPSLLPPQIVTIDRTVLAFAVMMTIATGLLFGIAPAWHAAKVDLNDMLKQSGRGSGGVRARLRNGLAAAELALATVLLVGAGLMIQTLLNLQRARRGFEPHGLLTFQRTREIGLRVALGAQPARVLRLVVGEGMTVGLIGIGIGLAGGLAVGRAVSSLVYGVPVRDPATFIGVAVALTLVALAACTIPARRASRVDPMIAIREE